MLKSRNWIRVICRLSVVIILASICTQKSVAENVKEEPGNPLAGQKLFFDKGCMRCHSIWGAVRKKGPSLASVGMGRNLYDLCASIWSHWPRMRAAMEPEKEKTITLNPSEIRDIIAYLYFLNYYKEPGDEALGRNIFLDRSCRSCHAIDPSTEAKLAPAVYQMVNFHGPISLAVALWNHGESMLQRMAERRIPWPQFKAKEVADLVSYIRAGNDLVPLMQKQLPGNPARGRQLFTSRSCADCHESTSGGPRIGPNLATTGAPESVSSVVAGLWNHYPKMVQAISAKGMARTQMTIADMEDLLAYVYWLRAYGMEGNSASGRVLYETKHCATCHSKTSEGFLTAPSLVGHEASKSPYAMLAGIWNHGPKMQVLLEERHIEWPALTGDEMRHIFAFFRQHDSRE